MKRGASWGIGGLEGHWRGSEGHVNHCPSLFPLFSQPVHLWNVFNLEVPFPGAAKSPQPGSLRPPVEITQWCKLEPLRGR